MGPDSSYVDAQDLYLEDVRGDTVRQGDTYVPLRVITEEIQVRGEDQPRTIRIRSSRHGPLLSDVDQRLQQVSASRSDPNAAQYAVALSWTALQPGRSMDALMAIDQAQNFEEFRGRRRCSARPHRTSSMPTPMATSVTSWQARFPIAATGTGRGRHRVGTRPMTGAAPSRSPSCRTFTTRRAAFSLLPISR